MLCQDIYTRLDKKGIQLASNQVRYSLLSRDIAKNGLLQACKVGHMQLIIILPVLMDLPVDILPVDLLTSLVDFIRRIITCSLYASSFSRFFIELLY